MAFGDKIKKFMSKANNRHGSSAASVTAMHNIENARAMGGNNAPVPTGHNAGGNFLKIAEAREAYSRRKAGKTVQTATPDKRAPAPSRKVPESRASKVGSHDAASTKVGPRKTPGIGSHDAASAKKGPRKIKRPAAKNTGTPGDKGVYKNKTSKVGSAAKSTGDSKGLATRSNKKKTMSVREAFKDTFGGNKKYGPAARAKAKRISSQHKRMREDINALRKTTRKKKK